MNGRIKIGNKKFLQDFLIDRIKNTAEVEELNRMYDVAVEIVTDQVVLNEDKETREAKETRSFKGVF